jgi:hypothetical protein
MPSAAVSTAPAIATTTAIAHTAAIMATMAMPMAAALRSHIPPCARIAAAIHAAGAPRSARPFAEVAHSGHDDEKEHAQPDKKRHASTHRIFPHEKD